MDSNSLSHTKWNCKYHIVFAPKFRRKIVYGKLKRDIANILSALCKRKGVKIVEAKVCPDHIHMLVEILPSISVSSFVGYLKGKSALMIFERHANLKYGAKTEVTLSYASSVSLAAFIAWMVASTIFNSLSSREPSMASMRFLHSLSAFRDG